MCIRDRLLTIDLTETPGDGKKGGGLDDDDVWGDVDDVSKRKSNSTF